MSTYFIRDGFSEYLFLEKNYKSLAVSMVIKLIMKFNQQLMAKHGTKQKLKVKYLQKEIPLELLFFTKNYMS